MGCIRVNMSKIPAEALKETIKQLLDESAAKKRKFTETIELQIVLKNYDTQKDKRFAGSIKLPNIPRPRMSVTSMHMYEKLTYCLCCSVAFLEMRSMLKLPRLLASLAWMWRHSSHSTRTRRKSRNSQTNTTFSWLPARS